MKTPIIKNITYTVVLILTVSVLSSCSTYNAATKRNELAFISPQSEMDMGRQIDQGIRSKYKISSDAGYQARVEKVGSRLAAGINRRGITYKFGVVEDSNLNAFTIPGGYVYATTGLMQEAKNDDELAAVLAHEMGHTEARHAVKHVEAAYGYDTLMSLAYIFDTRDKAVKDQSWNNLRPATDVVYKLASLGYSRKDEIEADRLSLHYMKSAGYDPNASLVLFNKLKGTEKNKDSKWAYFLRSHPYVDERIVAVKNELGKL